MRDRDQVRQAVWAQLRRVARPDSRFHFDFSEFIADFEGSDRATERLIELEAYQSARVVFITPDNCLEGLKAQAVRDNKILLTTTYGIRRGFIELLPVAVAPGFEPYAVLLDVIERVGRPISLAEIQQRYRVDLLVTGGSAVTHQGARFGKGHGFFDIEWATLYSIGAVEPATPIVDLVHDCQLVEEELDLAPYDTVCDFIVTPTRVIAVDAPQKPAGGIYWDRLEAGMLESISTLTELQDLARQGKLRPELAGKEALPG
ncbi:MAG TPA: 5-formyltetrahydrofolate cyclo-ligase [Anaerolineaceae bacterium]|nr:5-formyltetrahydrofolate cyclo-ligase [Anaerolineaceae bacterium]